MPVEFKLCELVIGEASEHLPAIPTPFNFTCSYTCSCTCPHARTTRWDRLRPSPCKPLLSQSEAASMDQHTNTLSLSLSRERASERASERAMNALGRISTGPSSRSSHSPDF